MRKDIINRPSRSDRMPTMGFSTPWLSDFFEPMRVFDNFSRDLFPYNSESHFLTPAIDIEETNDEYIVSADLPGVKKEDISIEYSDNQLTISAERKYESNGDRKTERRERYYGSYQRSFALPANADADKVEASYEGGVLTVHVPKGEQAKARKIEIGESKK